MRVVVLTGAGRSFSAGADLNWMKRAADYDEERNRADARALELMLRTIDECPKPVIAMVNGAAIGGGVGLVAACDIAVAAEGAQFATSEVRLGILPAVIAPFVVRAIGPREARRWFLTAERFGAAEARRIGLVHEVVPAGPASRRAPTPWWASCSRAGRRRWPGQAAGPARPRRCRRAAASWPRPPSRMIADRRASAEGKEGIGAFLEKRKPAWIEG